MALIATSFLCKNIELRIRRYNNENKILYFAKFITHSLSLLSIIIFKWKNFQINVFLYKKKTVCPLIQSVFPLYGQQIIMRKSFIRHM